MDNKKREVKENKSENNYNKSEDNDNKSENNDNKNEDKSEYKSEDKIKKEKSLTDYLLDLKVLSKLEVNQKLIIRENQLNIDTTYFQSINRAFTGDSRVSTLQYIEELNNNLSNEIENILDNYSKNRNIQDSPSNILINISQNLKLACKGLTNLTSTYISDNFNKSKIEIIIEQFQLKITKISEYIQIKK